MLGLILAVGVQMVTVGQFIEQIEGTGHPVIVGEGLDRAAVLTEGDVVAIGREVGIQLTTEFRRREVDRGKVQYLVWLLTPDEQEAKGFGVVGEEVRRHPNHGRGKHHRRHASECDPNGD